MASRRDNYVSVGVAVALTSAFCYVFLGPQRRELLEVRNSIRALESQLAIRTGDMVNISDIETNLERSARRLADYRNRVPETPELGDFVAEVSAIAERLSLRDQDIVPRAAEVVGALAALPVEIRFQAGFDAVFTFVREVERLPRVARVTELVIETATPKEEDDDYRPDRLNAELTLQVYYGTT